MAKTKTVYTDRDVAEFITTYVANEQQRNDSFLLVQLLQEWTGFAPKMWGPTIIGFGNYHYKYASGHEGDAPMLGFSPRKAAFSLYVFSNTEKSKQLLPSLGKFKMGKACIYVKKLSDIELPVLKALCMDSISYISLHHRCSCKEA